MNAIELLIRLAVGGAIFAFLVVGWTLVPLADADTKLNLTLVQFFYGNSPPIGTVRTLLLVSRAFLSLGISAYVLLPAANFFINLDYRVITNYVTAVLIMLSVVVFFVSLVVQQLFHV